MRRTLVLLPLAMPIALFMGCEGTAQNDTTTTDSALESCFASSNDGSTRCAIQGGGFSRDPQDVDHDGRPDSFVCAHIIKVPRGWMGGAGGSSGAASTDPSTGARPTPPPVPTDADCDHMGCQDQRPHHGGQGAGNGGADGKAGPTDPTSGPSSPSSADTSSTGKPAGDDADDMKCPGHDGQGQGPGQGAGGAGAPAGHGPGNDGNGGRGDSSGNGPGDGHGAGGAGVR